MAQEKGFIKRMKDFVGKWLFRAFITFIVFLPTEIIFGIMWFSGAESFWEKLAVLGLGIYFLGGLQLFFWFVFLGVWSKS